MKSSVQDRKFVCLDCEATGLNTEQDRIVEIALVTFTLDEKLDSFESLVNPHYPISEEAGKVHRITEEMVQGKPSMGELFPKIHSLLCDKIIVGHYISFDINLLREEAKRHHLTLFPSPPQIIDTLRLARNYGECTNNSLKSLRMHFNLPELGDHRAMNDVQTTISLFHHFLKQYSSLAQLLKRLQKPIELKKIPFGEYKGRLFSEIPLNYLQGLSRCKNFDEDLTYTIRRELKKRKEKSRLCDHCNPFSHL